jgi:hypothetical protein
MRTYGEHIMMKGVGNDDYRWSIFSRRGGGADQHCNTVADDPTAMKCPICGGRRMGHPWSDHDAVAPLIIEFPPFSQVFFECYDDMRSYEAKIEKDGDYTRAGIYPAFDTSG